jgi:branched-chain amino acid transport system substrate-binding protein
VPSSPTALAVGGVAAENKKIYIAGPAAADAITGANFNPYVFRCGRQNIQDALTMGAALVQLGENFIQISQDNAFGQGSAAGFYNVVKAAGGNFSINDDPKGAGAVFVPPETTDFTPYLNQILDSGADVLIVTWSGAGFVPMFQQMQQLGVFQEMAVATGMGDNQTLAQGYADAIDSVGVVVYHYTLFDTPENKYLTDEHIERFNTPPDLWAEAGFNCAMMIKQAVEATNGDTDGDALMAALEGMKFRGPKGDYEVRASDHALLQPMTLVKLLNTTDPDFKFFELVTRFEPAETAPPCLVPAELGRCN